MAHPDDLVRQEVEKLGEETAQISRNPSTQEEWRPIDKTMAIIAIIIAIIAIVSDFFSK